MNKYRIIASYVVECYYDIEAESKDQAWDLAYHIDGGDYKQLSQYGEDWQIERIEEL